MQFRQLLIFIACAVSAGPALAATYTVTDLGILPGGVSSTATSVDASGAVAGYTTYADDSTQAFYWTQSAGLVGLGGTNSKAFAIGGGSVGGQAGDQAFRWDPVNGMVLLDPGRVGEVRGLNASGEGVGTRILGSSQNRALTWSSANVLTNHFPTINRSGVALNDSGQFVGVKAGNTGGYYNDGVSSSIVDLGTFFPNALSNNLIAAGYQGFSMASYEDISTKILTSIGTLPGDQASVALGINPVGTLIVGTSSVVVEGPLGGQIVGSRGFLYDIAANNLASLTSLLDPAYSGWSITSANAITDSGLIAATGIFNGVEHAVLLTVPEPSTLVLVAFCAIALLTAKSRLRTKPRVH